MHRFFATRLVDNQFYLENSDLHQIKNVLRLKNSAQIICIYQQHHYLATITYLNNQQLVITKISELAQNHDPQVKITLVAGLIRSHKWDLMLQKVTELGVNRIVPFEFKRCVVHLANENNDSKIKRWEKIFKEASEQSYRNSIPKITNISNDLTTLQSYLSDINIVCYENENFVNSLSTVLKQDYHSITVIVGPEGGFEPFEIKELQAMGYHSVSLGSRILRAETAPIFLLSAIIYEKEL